MSKPMNSHTLRMMIETSVMTVLLACCAWITIPFGEVPFTLQTFGVFMAMRLLGGKWGTVCVAVYIALGAVNAPVFAGFKGGVDVLVGPTGGYIWGFLLTGIVYWASEEVQKRLVKKEGKMIRWVVPGVVLAIGLLLCYAFGTLWFINVMSGKGNTYTIGAALMLCVIPYLLPDAAKLVLALILGDRVNKALGRLDRK